MTTNIVKFIENYTVFAAPSSSATSRYQWDPTYAVRATLQQFSASIYFGQLIRDKFLVTKLTNLLYRVFSSNLIWTGSISSWRKLYIVKENRDRKNNFALVTTVIIYNRICYVPLYCDMVKEKPHSRR